MIKKKSDPSQDSNEYYNQFIYRVEKKLSVSDHKKLKDYAKRGIYLYIIHDPIDNNRFLFLSSQQYEANTKIDPFTFRFEKIASESESLHLKIKKSKFGINYFKIMPEKSDFAITFSDIITSKTKENKVFKQYKTHSKKIALDFPNWFLSYITDRDAKSYRKKALRLLLYQNKYNEEILETAISTMFQIKNPDFQKFNDHTIILDQGETGKSSIVGYLGEKIDNVSVAGLYGSSDSKNGKFQGGIITTTKKTILIDEINELIKNNKGDKVLSVLNSMLENGTYNYRKQFGQKIRASNQFIFMGNIGTELNFPYFLTASFGNIETLGRRISTIIYNDSLSGFEAGLIRPENPDPFLSALSVYMTEILNSILTRKDFITKLYAHKKYKQLSQYYKGELMSLCSTIECDTTRQFISSHKSALPRIVCRALKLWIFENINGFIANKKEYNNHTIYEILCKTETQLKRNILNFQNIKEHTEKFKIGDKSEDFNKIGFDSLNKTEKSLLKFIWDNRESISLNGTPYKSLKFQTEIKRAVFDYQRRKIPDPHIRLLIQYGVNIFMQNGEVAFKMINKKILETKLRGVFKEKSKKPNNTAQRIKNAWAKSQDDLKSP